MSKTQIDPRGQQFAAALTSGVLVAVLLTAPGTLGIVLLTVQAGLFAFAVLRGVQRTPVAALFRTVVRPRLAPPTQLEDADPPRFAQAVGLVFALVGLLGFTSGLTLLGYVATGFALVAALLNATIGLCLGCEAYLVGKRALDRVSPIAASSAVPATATTPRTVIHTVTHTATTTRSTP